MTIVKSVILGDTECGKTSFTQRWVTGNFPDPDFLRTTIGASFDTKKITLDDGRAITLSLWDFGGQRRFIDQLKAMIRGATIGLLFFDVSRLQTLDSVVNYWVPTIEENSGHNLTGGDGPRFMLVGNKVDLLERERIDAIYEEMDYVAKKYGMKTKFISARTGVGIENLDSEFIDIIQRYVPAE